jgi:hypothetical protein
VFNKVGDGKKTHYFITDEVCSSMLRLEAASDRKRMASLQLYGSASKPDSLQLQHHTFAMKMTLKKLNSH